MNLNSPARTPRRRGSQVQPPTPPPQQAVEEQLMDMHTAITEMSDTMVEFRERAENNEAALTVVDSTLSKDIKTLKYVVDDFLAKSVATSKTNNKTFDTVRKEMDELNARVSANAGALVTDLQHTMDLVKLECQQVADAQMAVERFVTQSEQKHDVTIAQTVNRLAANDAELSSITASVAAFGQRIDRVEETGRTTVQAQQAFTARLTTLDAGTATTHAHVKKCGEQVQDLAAWKFAFTSDVTTQRTNMLARVQELHERIQRIDAIQGQLAQGPGTLASGDARLAALGLLRR